jgi:hypothetical protein
MTTKEKKPKSREHKESKGQHGSGRKTHLTELQKVLISNGGLAHRLRSNRSLLAAPKTRKSRADKQAAR